MNSENYKRISKIKPLIRWTVFISILIAVLAFGPFSFEMKSGLPHVSFQAQRVYAAMSTDTFNATGTYTWTAPVGVATATIETWGAGGGGGMVAASTGGGGGGGGAYAKAIRNVTAGDNYTVIVGTGGAPDVAAVAGSSSFNGADVFALGGTGTNVLAAGAAGSGTNSSGTTKNAGGAGGAGVSSDGSAGGGGAGGPDGAGVTAATATSSAGTWGGKGDNNSGGAGGAGGALNVSGSNGTSNALGGGGGGGSGDTNGTGAAENGGNGGAPGGGGGGQNDIGGLAGTGGAGQVKITYNVYSVLADGTNPGNVTIAPEASATSSDAFTFQTSAGTDIVTAVTVGLTPNSTSGISKVEITSENGATVYGSSTDPTADSFSITLNESTLTATVTTTTYKIRLTPKTHANMPPPPGSEYAVTSTILSFTPTANTSSGTDGTSATITIDNLSLNNVTATSTTPGQGQIDLSWTNPGDGFSNVVIVRATSTPVTGAPDEGSSPSVGGAVGNGFVMYISNGTSTTDTGLADSTTYYYKIFAKDTSGNYSASGVAANATTNAPAPPQISSAANQTFTVGTINTISPITVTSTAASQITTANGIRITLATSTDAPVMFWNTASTTATISGSGDVSPTVTYENGSSTLVVNVLSDFANASSVTISNLSYVVSSTANAATTTRDLKWEGASQSPPFVRDAKTVTVKGALDVGEHSAGQASNQFNGTSTASTKSFFNFQLTPTGENASTTLQIQLSGVSGIITSDISGAKIIVDSNANGVVDAGETTTAFGAGTVNISGNSGTITFGTPTSVANSTSTRYILVATTTNLLADDAMTVGLAAANASATGTVAGLALSPASVSAPSNIAHTVPAVSRTQRSFRWQNDDGTTVNNNTNMAAADTAVTSTYIGQRLTLRIQIDNTGGGDGSTPYPALQYRLWYQANSTSGSWSDVASGNAIEPSSGLAGNNNDAITGAVAATNSNTFTPGAWTENGNISSSTTLLNSNYTEEGYVIETSRAASGTTYYFRVTDQNSNPIDAYPTYPSLITVASSSNVIQYSKQAGSLPNGTSSLTYFFDDKDYTNAATDDALYTTSTASANIPLFNFRVRNSTSTFPIRLTWKGQYSAASTTFVDAYSFGTNSWVNLNSTSGPPINSDFTLIGLVTSSLANFYEFDGLNYWVYFRSRQATTTSNFRTNYASVDFEPRIDSAADQTFQVNDGTTSISQMTITTARTPVITAANDIRIKIPSSLNMSWATSTTSATLGGTAESNVSTTVSYPDDKTLLLNVLTDFVASDTLIVSDLSFRNFTAASASTTLQAIYSGSSTIVDAVDSRIKQIKGIYTLGSHPAGEPANKFDIGGLTSITSSTLLTFQIAPAGENATTSQIVINLSNISGFITSDVTSAQLIADSNGNGEAEGDESAVGGSGSVSISGGAGSITFSSSFAVTSTITMNLILTANVGNINPEDTMTFSVAPSGISATGQTSLIALSPSGSSLSASHSHPSVMGGGGSLSGGTPPAVSNESGGVSGGDAGMGGGGVGNIGGGGAGGGAVGAP